VVGGVVPLGYRVEDRALHIVEDHAEIVRSLFRRYLEAGSVAPFKQRLDAEGFRLPARIDGAGRSTGGGALSRGHLYKILSNPIYVGRIVHKGQAHEGQHEPIVPQELWDQVQQSLRDHLGAERTKRTPQASEALLAGKLFDDRGNRMSPTWARRGPKRWRYYVSQAVLQADKGKAGSIVRVPAADVETLVAEALRKHSPTAASQTDIRDLIDRVVIGRVAVQIPGGSCGGRSGREDFDASVDAALALSQARDHPGRRRCRVNVRPMRANARAILIEALGDAHRWLDELLSDPRQTLESREGKTERSIRMTLSLAFLAPEIVKAAVEGRLPRGFGLKRLVDLPMAWPDQWRALGLQTSTRVGTIYVRSVVVSPGLDECSHSIVVVCPHTRRTRRKQQLRKRKFAARDFRPHAPPKSRGDGRKGSADRLLLP
jgi:site-specific DNA recombinase